MAFDYDVKEWSYVETLNTINGFTSGDQIGLMLGITGLPYNTVNHTKYISSDKKYELIVMYGRVSDSITYNELDSKGLIDGTKEVVIDGVNYHVISGKIEDIRMLINRTPRALQDNNTTMLTSSPHTLDSDIISYYLNSGNFSESYVSKSSARGYRPLYIRRLNHEPTISIKDTDLGDLLSFNPIEYIISDTDVAQTMTVVEKVDDSVIRTLVNQVSGTTLTLSLNNFDNLTYGKHTIEVTVTDNSTYPETTKVNITFNKIKAPIAPLPTIANLKQAVAHSKEIDKEIEYQCVRLKDTLTEKGVTITNKDTLATLISKITNLTTKGGGYLPNQPYTLELGFWNTIKRVRLINYLNNKLTITVSDSDTTSEIPLITEVDLSTGKYSGWNLKNNLAITNSHFTVFGEQTEDKVVVLKTLSSANQIVYIFDMNTGAKETFSVPYLIHGSGDIHRVGDIIYWLESSTQSSSTKANFSIWTYDINTKVKTRLYISKVDPYASSTQMTVYGNYIYIMYYTSESVICRVDINKPTDIEIISTQRIYGNNRCNGRLIVTENKIYSLPGYLGYTSDNSKIIIYDRVNDSWSEQVIGLGSASNGMETSFFRTAYVGDGSVDNLWVRADGSVSNLQALFLKLRLNN